ncbi:MAG: GNAT family N-acetyltransferase [Deltaproteobacteria bacterium]|nr:GNAT family N-acetyltransferase [Deltaproteobacteria bacterium]
MAELAVEGLALRRATTADGPAIQAVLDDDPATWELLEGAPLVPNEGELMLPLVPPGGTIANKHLFVAEGACVIDLYAGYPQPHIWYLGLIFLTRAIRGEGLGTRVLACLAAFVRAHGGTALRLGVVAENAAARRFYDRLGFRHVFSKQRPTPSGGLTDLDVLELAL